MTNDGLTFAQIRGLADEPLDPDSSAFASEAARKAAWQAHSGHIWGFCEAR